MPGISKCGLTYVNRPILSKSLQAASTPAFAEEKTGSIK